MPILQTLKKEQVLIDGQENMCYTLRRGKPESRAAYPLLSEGLTLQTKERRALPMCVTYSDLIQIGIFIVALVGLCYQIFKGKRK